MKSRGTVRATLALLVGAVSFAPAYAHDVITTNLTWNREISRIIYERCASCHRPGGTAFSLLTYREARPWAKSIQEETLERRMPPWGAVKGYGEFKEDPTLTPEQIEVIAEWVDGGAPEGDDEKELPQPPKASVSSEGAVSSPQGLQIDGDTVMRTDFMVGALLPESFPPSSSPRISVVFPNGTVQPLIWLLPFQPAYRHVFRLKEPLLLPRGAEIRGVPAGARLTLFPATIPATSENALSSPGESVKH